MSGSQRSRPRILLADDDVIFRSLCISKLKTLEAEIIEADDGVEAWHLIKNGGCSLALLDIDMPNMNGVALAQCIRSHHLTRQTPIVMITSREDVSTLRQTLQAGATSYLTKPVNWSLFMDHISHLLSLGHAAQRPDSGTSRFAALYEASNALTRLCRVELARQVSPVAGRDARLRLLGRLQEAIAAAAVADETAIEVDGVLAQAIANGDRAAVDVENQLAGSCITAAAPAFAALVSEIVAFGASMGRDGAPARVTLEGTGADVCLWVHFDPTNAGGGEEIAFMVEGIGVLALLNRGEVFIDEAARNGALGFGVRLPGVREGHDTLRGPADFATAV